LAVLAVALVRLAVTVAFGLDIGDAVLEVSTVALFVVPVGIASLNFGVTGGLATVAWVAVLDIPRMVDAADHAQVPALWSEVVQLVVLLALALLIGTRVTAETRFREQADAARTARFETEALYQDMFESNRSPILVVDGDGHVVGANAAAEHAFATNREVPAPAPSGRTGDGPGRRLVDVVGADAAAVVLTRLLDDGGGGDGGTPGSTDGTVSPGPVRMAGGRVDDGSRPLTFEVDGRRVLYRPTSTLVGAPGPHRRMQVIFEDVTTETRRHDLMEAYAGQVVLGQEEERRHIAQELHDGPLQALIHICRQIDALEGTTDSSGATDRRGGATLASMRSSVEDTVAELRSIARGLRPSVLDDLGLVASINQVLTEATEREGFQSAFTVDGTVTRLPPAVELAVFRIAQEAVTNAARHAHARRVDVGLQFGDGWLDLSVADDGAGFDPQSEFWGDTQSLGLPGMSERARLIGGRFTVTSQAGQGTTVQVRVPLGLSDTP
jgi:signal transduction histidine kinase